MRSSNCTEHRPPNLERLFIWRLIFFARWQLLHRPQIDNQFIEHPTKTYHKYAFAQITVVFGIAFMAVALPGVSRIEQVDDVAFFVESEAAVNNHVYLLFGIMVRPRGSLHPAVCDARGRLRPLVWSLRSTLSLLAFLASQRSPPFRSRPFPLADRTETPSRSEASTQSVGLPRAITSSRNLSTRRRNLSGVSSCQHGYRIALCMMFICFSRCEL